MDKLKILKYATCRVTIMLDTNQFDNSRCSVCTLLTFGSVVLCRLPFDHAQTSVQTEK
jgi:hypothetical protein